MIYFIFSFVRLLNGNIILNVDWNSSLVCSIEESKIERLTLQDLTYNSPEFSEFNLIDSKYDIWCVGWCLYELCTLDDVKPLLNETNLNWPRLSLPQNSSDKWNDLFVQMTHLNPNMRPTASEILANSELFNENEFHFGDCVLRRFKIGEKIESNAFVAPSIQFSNESWRIIDLKESNKK